MQNVKPFKTIEEQIEILRSRGLIIKDNKFAYDTLLHINYYRLSAYSLTHRNNDTFDDNATFENIVQLYKFDESLRAILLKYCSIVELSFRTYISYIHSQKYGALGYLNHENFLNQWNHVDFLAKCRQELKYFSNEPFISHHNKDLNSVFPFWVIIETISFSTLSKLFKNLKNEDKTIISKEYFGTSSREYIESWLKGCVDLRNICAHSGRLYNKKFTSNMIQLSNKVKQIIVRDDEAFAYIYGLFMLLPNNLEKKSMVEDIRQLFEKMNFAQPRYLGMPCDWDNFLLDYLITNNDENKMSSYDNMPDISSQSITSTTQATTSDLSSYKI